MKCLMSWFLPSYSWHHTRGGCDYHSIPKCATISTARSLVSSSVVGYVWGTVTSCASTQYNVLISGQLLTKYGICVVVH